MKRQASITNNDNESKKQKQDSNNTFVTQFEHLSNDVIYEIFDYFDYSYLYEVFRLFNQRFYNLIIQSNLPINANFSIMSKQALQNYNRNIIKPNIDRIMTLKISNAVMYDFVLRSIGPLSQFHQIIAVILDDIEENFLIKVLDQLSSLPLLSSLIVSSTGPVKRSIYQQIFHLPVLKYCKLSLKFRERYNNELPVSNNEYSPLEQLVITHSFCITEVDRLLSYVPHLRSLSLLNLNGWRVDYYDIPWRCMNFLTHFSCELGLLKFVQFTQLLVNMCAHIQVLHLTLHANDDSDYMDAKQWEELIVYHLPNLRIFGFKFERSLRSKENENINNEIEEIMKPFQSLFWLERQWFFTYECYMLEYSDYIKMIVYSINPYRRKKYQLCNEQMENQLSIEPKCNLENVKHVIIEDARNIRNCRYYFPNATELTFDDASHTTCTAIGSTLKDLVCLQKLTKFTVNCDRFSIQKLTKILYYAPNLKVLSLTRIVLYTKESNGHMSIIQSSDFQKASRINSISEIKYQYCCKLEHIQLLTALCPQVKLFTTKVAHKDLEPIVRFLLDEHGSSARQLCTFCIRKNSSVRDFRKFKTVSKLIRSHAGCTLKTIDGNLTVWW